MPSKSDIGPFRLGVHLWAIFTTLATFLLLCSGGIVTSKGVGMSVPDWPTTYGYNMFVFPFDKWVGGIFYEHSHRLIASGVGLFTMILAAGILTFDPRKWMKTLAIVAFLAVCVQGLLGGLRVTLYKDEIGIFHAMLAQSFFCLLAIITVSTSPAFLAKRWDVFVPDATLRRLVIGATVLIFAQLALGATMRHEHAGLSIKDFPLAYGKILPDTSPERIAEINAERVANNEVPTNALFIWIQMAHRAGAVGIFALVLLAALRAMKTKADLRIRAWAWTWVAAIILQVVLGAYTIWSNKAADVATAHMALGALALLFGALFSYRLVRGAEGRRFLVPDTAGTAAATV